MNPNVRSSKSMPWAAIAGRGRPCGDGARRSVWPTGLAWLLQALTMGLIASALGLATAPAHAHAASDAFLTLRIDGSRVEQRLDVALRDLDRALDLDADRDGTLRWGEVRRRWPSFEPWLDRALTLQAGGQPCTRVSAGEPLLERHTGGVHAVLRRAWRCPGLGDGPAAGAATPALRVDYRLFETVDPTHRGIARVTFADDPERVETRVLVPGQRAEVQGRGQAPVYGAAGFFVSGLTHIAGGLDHVLFLATLLLVVVWRRSDNTPATTGARGRLRRSGWVPRARARDAWSEVLRIVTAFTVAHSVTLGLAAAGVLAPPARWIEPLIAISVAVAALDNLRPVIPGPRWVTVAVFGLLHGFGFAGPLQDLGLQGGALAVPLLAFNLGVEAGQLLIVLALMPLALAWRHADAYRRWVVQPASAAVAVLALAWTAERALAVPLLPF